MMTNKLTTRGSTRRHGGSTLGRYFADIRRFRVQTREEESRLGREARDGRRDSFDRLIESNLQFVVSVANEYRNRGLPLEDLINEGNLGLIEAARRFDPTRGTKFITWAVWWIRNSIRNALSDQAQIVRLPGSQRRKMSAVRSTEQALEQDLGRVPTREELAKELPRELKAVDPIHRHGIRFSSIDQPGSDGDDRTLADSIEDARRPSIERELIDRQTHETLNALCDRLDDVHKTVIVGRFGLDGETPRTLAEIGRRIGRSREGVRLIEGRAMKRLRQLTLAADEQRRSDGFDSAA